ncbi:hypothetical protein DY000_02047536 [Brassica cretica]|uniref:Uncharacterized protein n=1 Tax=Brassica cretica TaxID=69181 RepID=A0ABQ7F5M9_BRACR|nr:hypothetical protein DY000_02047536 [Brassica cretica]
MTPRSSSANTQSCSTSLSKTLTEAEEPEDIFQLHGELEAKSLGAPGTCVAELLEAWILDGVGVEQDGREEMELVQKLEKRDR